MYGAIPEVPVELILPHITSYMSLQLPLTFNVVSAELMNSLLLEPPTNMEQFQEIYTSLKSHAKVLSSDVVDEFTKNKALVRLLQDSELYHARDFIVDYQFCHIYRVQNQS